MVAGFCFYDFTETGVPIWHLPAMVAREAIGANPLSPEISTDEMTNVRKSCMTPEPPGIFFMLFFQIWHWGIFQPDPEQ
jgi:hypothetical protein